ncbi:glycosyltransferase [Cellulomonas sp. URHB0016]
MTETLPPVGLPTATAATPVTTPVTAVVVTRGVTRYLVATLEAIASSRRRPLRVVVVDAGADPDQRVPPALERAFAAVVDAPRPQLRAVAVPGARTFGDAVRRALGDPDVTADGPATPWLWLLHDDSAPAPSALGELVKVVGHARSVAVAGAKQRTWTEPERLLEVGVRTSPAGRRMTDVEPGELDQGQHDGRVDVLSVGLAGALVRRDVWDDLGGPDPVLGPFGDGADLSRRARLAGHRVVVVPSAVVRHAQAGYLGLRGDAVAGQSGTDEPVDLDGDGMDDAADPRRSFRERRRASLHARLVGAPVPLVPVVAVLAVLGAVLRACGQLAAKQPGLAVDELVGVLLALLRPRAVARARARARRTRRLSRRTLRPLQASWREVWTQAQDRRLARAAARRVVQAPSELELRELAELTTRRRTTLGVVVVLLVAATSVAWGSLVGPVVGGARLVGGALAPAVGDLGSLWVAATSGWVADELGGPGPTDPLLTVLVGPTALTGGSLGTAVAVLLLGAVVLSGVGAWAAAGAATRSTVARAWAAVVWACAPVLLIGVGDGRLGPVVAHAALPWVALGLARGLGVQRVDQVLSGLVTARRSSDDDDVHGGDVPGGDMPGGDVLDGDEPGGDATRRGAEADDTTPVRGVPTVPTQRVSGDGAATPADRAVAPALVGAPDPTGSIAGAAGAALAFTAVVAGAPALLVPGVLALLAVALGARRRRGRVLLVAVPALVLLAPTLVEAGRRGLGGWRLLLAGPGLPTASTGSDPVGRLLGVPSDASALVPDSFTGMLATAWPWALGAVVLVLAVLALLRGAPVARAVRTAWVVAVLGLAAATVAVAVPVAVADGTVVHGWAGPGVSLASAGLVAAALLGADRVRDRLARRSFGWRQPVVALLTAVAVVVPLAGLGGWAFQARAGSGAPLHTVAGPVVPAVGQQAQLSPLRSRILALAVGPDAVSWQLMRGDGPMMVDGAAAVSTRTLDGDLTDPTSSGPDAATDEVQSLVARLASGASGDVAGPLAALAVADVLVPAVPSGGGEPDGAEPDAGDSGDATAARDELVSRLDATAGLERVTQNAAGTLWRVRPATPGTVVVPAWARVLDGGATVTDPAATAVPVASEGRTVDTDLPAGAAGRQLVLAERADPHWHAWLDGRPLRAVDQGWRQGFELPASGGRLVVRLDVPDAQLWLVAQGLVALVTVLLAVPVRRRRAARA